MLRAFDTPGRLILHPLDTPGKGMVQSRIPVFRRRAQVVREGPAKPLCSGSIPLGAFFGFIRCIAASLRDSTDPLNQFLQPVPVTNS